MIVFLTLVYVALLALLAKLSIIKLTLFWKLSPVIWMLFLLVLLFIPMQWGAPAGQVVAIQKTVEILPGVGGEVVEVQAESLVRQEKGDVLFRIDPVPFQAEVTRLEAALKEAEQNAKALPAVLAAAKANVREREVALTDAEKQAQKLHAALDVATAGVRRAEADLELAKANLERDEATARQTPGAVSKQQLDTRRAAVNVQVPSLTASKAEQEQARLAYEAEFGGEKTIIARAQEQLRGARAAEEQAQLALDSTINGVNTTVAQIRAQLENARFNLEQTTVVAPADGYPVAMTLRPGQRVANLPLRTWMSFVESEQNRLIAGIHHYALKHVKIGQKAEVVFNVFPGQTFSATVEAIGAMTPEGQLGPSGNVPRAPVGLPRSPFPVYLKLDDTGFQLSEIPGGSIGTAAIYTESVQATHIVRRVMIRMESWLNFIIP